MKTAMIQRISENGILLQTVMQASVFIAKKQLFLRKDKAVINTGVRQMFWSLPHTVMTDMFLTVTVIGLILRVTERIV